MHLGAVEIQIYCFYFSSCSVFSALYNMNSMYFKRSSALLYVLWRENLQNDVSGTIKE